MAWFVLFGWLVVTGLLTLRDVARARRLAAASDVIDVRHFGLGEPKERQAVLETLADRLAERPENIDEALLGAYRATSALSFGLPRGWALIRDLLVGSAVALPFGSAVLRAVQGLAEASATLAARSPRQALVEASELYLEPTRVLAEAFGDVAFGSSLLLAGAALHHLGQAERVREARFVDAMTRAAVRIAGDVPAAAGIRVFPHFAAPTDLTRPVIATFAALVSLTAAWVALTSSAPLRAERGTPLKADLWPADAEAPVELPPGLQLPVTSGGHPVGSVTGTFFMTRSELKVGSIVLGSVIDGALPPDWERIAEDRIELAGGLPELGPSVIVAADPSIRALDVRALLVFVERRVRGAEISLLVARETGSEGRQAALRTRTILPRAGSRPVLVFLGRRQVSWDGRKLVNEPKKTLRAWMTEAIRRERPLDLGIEVGSKDVSWGEMVGLIGAADVSCATGPPCWLPGMGVELRWLRSPPSD